jgi:hypothetical protein
MKEMVISVFVDKINDLDLANARPLSPPNLRVTYDINDLIFGQ